MRVTAFHIVPANPAAAIELDTLHPADPGRYLVRQVGGLDADEVKRQFYGRGLSSGKKFYNRSLGMREVVVVMNLNPRFGINESYPQLRDDIYRMIGSSRTGQVDLKLMDGDTTVAVLTGPITKVEATLFEEKPAAAVTIECDYPLPQAPERVALDLSSIEVPGTINISDPLSTAEHGLVLNFKLTEAPEYLEIFDNSEDWVFRVNAPAGGFYDDDEVIFSSEYNLKKVYLSRGDDLIGLADVIASGSIWPLVFPGENVFHFSTDNIEWGYVGHYPTYWGV